MTKLADAIQASCIPSTGLYVLLIALKTIFRNLFANLLSIIYFLNYSANYLHHDTTLYNECYFCVYQGIILLQ